jgi:methionine-gamma-lyase
MKNFFPKLGINTSFVPITDLEVIKSKITPKTKVLYCETISNPLLEVADIVKLSELCKEHDIKLIVDNTFSPMLIRPYDFGADIVIHSLTKYINGASDTVGGVICASKEFIGSLKDVSNGATMLLGPTMDSLRAQSIFKNIRTLHIRMHQHSKNGMYIATKLRELGVRIYYTGFEDHPQHELMKSMLTPGYGFGGMITIDVGTTELSNQLMVRMQENMVGYFAVSLGFYKTLFSSPGHSTSSEIPEEERAAMGLTDGLVRFSVGLDNDIERSFERIRKSLIETGIVKL